MPRKTYGRYGGTASQAGLRVHAPVCFAGGRPCMATEWDSLWGRTW